MPPRKPLNTAEPFDPDAAAPYGGRPSKARDVMAKPPYEPPVLTPLYHLVWAAADTFNDDADTHPLGTSPSTVMDCRLRQWLRNTGVPRTNRLSPETIKKLEAGKVIESFWRDVYSRAGFEVESPLPRIAIPYLTAGGAGDGGLTVATRECSERLSETAGRYIPVGSRGLLELKDLGVWSFFDVMDKGWVEGKPDYFYQAQAYMEGYDCQWCIMHAGQADASSVKFVWSKFKKRPDRQPGFWLELVHRQPEVFARMVDRAREVNYYVENILEPHEAARVLRDYNVWDKHDQDSGKGFPCHWCGHKELCLTL